MIDQKAIPYKGVDFDTSESWVEAFKAVFLKNVSNDINDNTANPTLDGGNSYSFTPLESNVSYCNVTMPAGQNYCCGFKYFKNVRQAYVCVWNSEGDHFIYRMNCALNTCEKVYTRGECLDFQLDPVHFIGTSRMTLETICRFNKSTGQDEDVLYLILTDDYSDQKMICVNDSIATNSFNATDFPFFAINGGDCQPCYYIRLGLPQNLKCITVEPVPRLTPGEEGYEIDSQLPNTMVNNGWEFRVKGTDVWRRPTEHGVISTKYIPIVGGSCVTGSNGLPRCVKLTFDAGCPIIDKLTIEFRKCNGNVKGLSVESDWFEYDVINKYNDCENNNWWERTISDDPDQGWIYNDANNTIEYIFCGNEGCKPIDVNETNRNENDLPLTSGGVASLNKGIILSKNSRRFEPLSCSERDKMQFSVQLPAAEETCQNKKVVKITVYGVLYSVYDEYVVAIRTKDGKNMFGTADCENNNPTAYAQVLPGKQEGIIGHLLGSDNYCISKQYKYDRVTGTEELIGMAYTPDLAGRYIPVQKWEFTVDPGKYVFMVSSHQSSPADAYEKTSTNFKGQTSLANPGVLAGGEKRELLIDACAGDVTIKESAVMIYDLTRLGNKGGCGNASNVTTGYIYEDQVEKRPIEKAAVVPNQGAVNVQYTDRNGYYFAASKDRGLQTEIWGKKNCVYSKLAVSRISYDTSGSWHRHDVLYAYTGENKYLDKDRAIVTGKVYLCGEPGIGIGGVLVILTNGSHGYTADDGIFRIVAHDQGNSSTRSESLIYSQRGNCVLMSCGTGCDYCIANKAVVIPACAPDRVVNITDQQVRINGFNKKGPHMGGRYGAGIVLHDWAGRQTYVQGGPQHFIDVPPLQETKVYDFCKLFFDITGMVLPGWVKKVSFFLTENLNEDDYLTWVAERIVYTDITGKINNSAPTKIRLYYESLAEFNKQNGFSTNTNWDFITATDDSVITGDYIEFLANGDGIIFPKVIRELVQYDKEGSFVTVPYTEDLKGLKDGALIRFVRSKQCQGKQFYYEVCPMIDVIEGIPQVLTGELQFFDAYLINRQIPVPVTTSIVNGAVTTSTTENQLRHFPFFFEHHSPSDLWGDHCQTKGRVNVLNPLESKLCLKTEVILSKSLNQNNLYNGLGYFSMSDAKVFPEQEWQAITAVFTTLNRILVICGNKNFIAEFNDTAVRVNDSGQIYAPSGSERVGEARNVKGSGYGVQLFDINTLSHDDDIIVGLDSEKAELILFSFNGAEPLIAEAAVKSWFHSNIRAVQIYNNSDVANKKYFHGVIDKKRNEYVFTLTKTKQVEVDYGNDRGDPASGEFDTLVFSIATRSFRGNRSYTPEYYGSMGSDVNDIQLVSFKGGQSFKHHWVNNSSTSFCNFYGIQYTPVFEFVFNKGGDAVKNWKSLALHCRQLLLYADRIKTSSGQLSRLMPLWWRRGDKYWVADFKCDLNTVADTMLPAETGANKMLDGDMLRSEWIRIRIRPKNADRSRYFEFISLTIFIEGNQEK